MANPQNYFIKLGYRPNLQHNTYDFSRDETYWAQDRLELGAAYQFDVYVAVIELELEKQITFDALTPWHDHPMRAAEFRRIIEAAGFEIPTSPIHRCPPCSAPRSVATIPHNDHMCGILGLVQQQREIDTESFGLMLDTLARRGPDGRGIQLITTAKSCWVIGVWPSST